MSDSLRETLGTLATLPGVRAAVAATVPDGLSAAAVSSSGVEADALAAFATALFQRTRAANVAAGYGDTVLLALDAGQGRLFIAPSGELVFVVLTDPDASAGLVRVALQRAARATT